MITAPTALQNLLKQSSYIQSSVGCTIEYNWNSMTNLTDSSVGSSGYWESKTNVFPFKKLFPVDSIIKPFRPVKAGIKYAILGSASGSTIPIEGETKVYSQSGLTYSKDYRLYYPGVDTSYKYWVSKKDDDNQYLTITYPKDIVANKIVIKFEISHSIPTSFSVLTTGSGVTDFSSATSIFSGTSSDVPTFSGSKPGVLTLYYNGSAWSTTESSLSMSSYATIRGIKLNLTSITGYVGVIEMSPRLIKDVSDYIESFTINKESSSNNDDIIPVGYVSSNSLEMSLVNYNTSAPQMVVYKPAVDFAIDGTKLYLYKNAELRPYIKITHANGASGSDDNKYDIVYQGYFYIESWNDTDTNDISITALDGAKSLQETICPPILCKDYSVAAIIRRMLDAIGFTTYNFNYKMSGDSISDTSVISLNYWWTENNITIWEAIQELCRDSQITAVFDESGVLQFYTREYMYDSSRSASWPLTYDTDGSTLANIESFNKRDIPTANQVKILWRGTTTSEYESDDQPLWSADPTFLAGAGLTANLLTTDEAGSYVSVKPISTKDSSLDTLLSYSGYLAIDDEIIEYDAIEYSYTPIGGGNAIVVNVANASDLLKYRSLAEPGSTSMKPTGRYRIKNRALFGTTKANHYTGYDYASWAVTEIGVK